MHTKENKMLKISFCITRKMKNFPIQVARWVHIVLEVVIPMRILAVANRYMLNYDTDTSFSQHKKPVNKFHAYSAIQARNIFKGIKGLTLALK